MTASSSALQPVIVGAGPAGVRAAETLVAHGVRPTVIDEASRAGGQIYRRPPASLAQRSAQALYGFEARRADAVHAAFDALQGRIDYRPDSLVWNAHGGRLDVLPVPGWTLPGVYTLGGAQVALKFQGCAIGQRVVFLSLIHI